MIFRTEIDLPAERPAEIKHGEGIVMLGSCFTDSVGSMLVSDGFTVTHNPLGPLYNPCSIANAVRLALCAAGERDYTLLRDTDGLWHCLDFASRYTRRSKESLVAVLDEALDHLRDDLQGCQTAIITLGTAYVFALADGDGVVGNCHKFPPQNFSRERLTVEAAAKSIERLKSMLPDKHIILTVSPIRHTADGLHGNNLSKSILQLAADSILDERTHYFPAYEIMLDDLRDYRFYAADMKHPSDTAVEYIYETFCKYYMTTATAQHARLCRKQRLREAHRPIIKEI